MVALVGPVGGGQVDDRARCVPRLYDVDARRGASSAGVDVRDLTFDAHARRGRAWSPRTGTCSTTRSRPTCATPRPDATDAELSDALHRARLGELVAALPDGLDTVVGERGYRLSGGERQRLTIARLLLARPRVVILDEATAHLDSESEAAVQEALVEALDGRTAIVIAHRLSTIRAADQILVVEDGADRRARHARPSCSRAGGRYAELLPHPVRAPRRRPGRLPRHGPRRSRL